MPRDSSFRAARFGNDQVSLGGPGAADVRFLPNLTEHPEPGGVNWTDAGRRGVEPPTRASV